MANGTRTAPVPTELLRARTVLTYCLEMLAGLDTWAEQAADVVRKYDPDRADRLDGLRDQLRTGLAPGEMGTPAAIQRVVAELLD